MYKLRHTCGASTGNVITSKIMRANSPHCERVAWSWSQIIHCDYVRRTHLINTTANQCVRRCWHRALPCERQWISRRVDNTALSTYHWRWNTTTNIQSVNASQYTIVARRFLTVLQNPLYSKSPQMLFIMLAFPTLSMRKYAQIIIIIIIK